MEMNEYQKQAKTFDVSSEKIEKLADVGSLSYSALKLAHSLSGLAEEIGEVQGKFKKYLRGDLTADQLKELISPELGDVLWYLSDAAKVLGIKLDDIAKGNISKLTSRKRRGKIKGDGDKR